MIDYKPILKAELESILPTYYELFVDSKTPIPCITYQEIGNVMNADGDTIRYSNLAFYIKLWGNDLEELSHYRELIDLKMFKLNFQRVSYQEMFLDTKHLVFIMRFDALAIENLGGF